MKTKTVAVDFGAGKLNIDVPDDAVVVEFADPQLLENPEDAVRKAIAEPYGSAPLRERAEPGMTVAIGFDDITRPPVPPQTILPILVQELLACGVRRRDITFINACSNHRKNTRAELAAHLGPTLFNEFWRTGQIRNHDCTDDSELKYFGVTDGGRVVEMNRRFVEADLMIYQGNVAPMPFKTFTGTGVIVGFGSTRSIASHHSFHGIPDPTADKGKAKQKAHPSVKEEMTTFLDERLGKEVFYVNTVTGIGGKLVGVFAGSAAAVKPPAWELAQKIFPKRVPQADVLIIGLPAAYAYGSADNTLIAAVGACVPPRYFSNKPILREGGVVIALTPSKGEVNADVYPSYQEVIDLYDRYFEVRQLVDHEDEFNFRPEYRHKYTHGHGYPPLHPFWLMYELEYILNRASAVVIAGAPNPGPFRQLGLRAAKNFDEAWQIAIRSVGPKPTTVVAPTFFSKPRIKFDVRD
ncbi:lactate racemase domain-containing protein [Pseudorhodoplanes sp.]|uniref:lactate racemase domain-containing protein n=1 Tax=Pseudorhodoplanes sp. TaxID=1934341 RepID=UPI003D14C7CA